MRSSSLSLLAAVCLFSGCPSGEPPPTTATVSGSVRVFQGANAARRSALDPKRKARVLEQLNGEAKAHAVPKPVLEKLAPAAKPRLLVGGAPRGANEPPRIRLGEVIVRFTEKLGVREAAARLLVPGYVF